MRCTYFTKAHTFMLSLAPASRPWCDPPSFVPLHLPCTYLAHMHTHLHTERHSFRSSCHRIDMRSSLLLCLHCYLRSRISTRLCSGVPTYFYACLASVERPLLLTFFRASRRAISPAYALCSQPAYIATDLRFLLHSCATAHTPAHQRSFSRPCPLPFICPGVPVCRCADMPFDCHRRFPAMERLD